MAYLPSLDRYDLAVFVTSLVLLFFAYVVFPIQIVKISVWFLVFTLYVGWMAFLLYKWMFDIDM